MAVRKFILGALMVCMGTFVMAGYGENSFKKKVGSHMMYPEFSNEQNIEAKVYVEFTVLGKGKIEINKIESTNDKINEYVIRKLKEVSKEASCEVIGKTYKYNFSFEVQK